MLIAFVAPKQFGKSTACSILKKHWGDDVAQINFKDGLIAEIKQNFPDLLQAIQYTEWAISCAHDDDWLQELPTLDKLFQEKPPLIRTLMQNYGTEVRRGDQNDYWVEQWRKSYCKNQGAHVLTDDVRFINEAVMIKNNHGTLIRLDRTDKTSTDTHVSETEQASIKCDYTITCGEGEFEELERQLLQIVQQLV